MHLCNEARIMLTSNLWIEAGLVNGAMGTVKAIAYLRGSPLNLPQVVMVKFDRYSGLMLNDGTVPIVPLKRTWLQGTTVMSRQQLPLKLAWAITIHKEQGSTMVLANVFRKGKLQTFVLSPFIPSVWIITFPNAVILVISQNFLKSIVPRTISHLKWWLHTS